MARIAILLDRMLTVACLTALVSICYVSVRPGGALRLAYDRSQLQRRQLKAVAAAWPRAENSAGRIGSPAGRLVAIEFADYECPYCRALNRSLESLLASNDSISIAYVHFPLAVHKAADGAARASICAQAQGKFARMHALLFETTQWQHDQNWAREAVAAGVQDTAEFGRCIGSVKTLERLEADKRLGRAVGVTGTPTVAALGHVWVGTELPQMFWTAPH